MGVDPEVEGEAAVEEVGEERPLFAGCAYLEPTRWMLNWSPRGQVTLFFFLQ